VKKVREAAKLLSVGPEPVRINAQRRMISDIEEIKNLIAQMRGAF